MPKCDMFILSAALPAECGSLRLNSFLVNAVSHFVYTAQFRSFRQTSCKYLQAPLRHEMFFS